MTDSMTRCIKKILVLLIAFLLPATLFSRGKELHVKISNPSKFERMNETVALRWKDISAKLPALQKELVVVLDAKLRTEILSQIADDELVFQSNFKANQTETFIIKNEKLKTEKPKSLVAGRFVEPRQDYAWENDRIAFRTYGPALAKEVNNGIDVWTKRVRHLIVEKWYRGEADTGAAKLSYHVDRGEGADFFSVGKTLGAGGCGIWHNGRVYQPGVFSSWRTLANGPIRLVFELTYDSLVVEGRRFREVKRITLDAGRNLNKIEATYHAERNDEKIEVAVGLVKRNDVSFTNDEKRRWMSLWGATNADTLNGSLGTGVVLTRPFEKILEDTDQHLAIGEATSGEAFVYYTGAGWTRSGDFSSDEDWRGYVSTFARSVREPLKVRFVN